MPQSSNKFSCCLNRARRSGESRGTSAKLFTSLNSIRNRNRASVVFKIIETSSQFETFAAGAEILRPDDGCFQVSGVEEVSISGMDSFDRAPGFHHLADVADLIHDRHHEGCRDSALSW